jgi:hypothetical protein
LLIVIGNPKILQQDPNWRRLLEFIKERGGCTGVNFTSSSVDALPPLDLDTLRVPVTEKLKKQLDLTVAALRADKNTDIEALALQMMDLTLASGIAIACSPLVCIFF